MKNCQEPELLPCPFCGGVASITDCESHSNAYEIGCRENADCPLSPEIWDTDRSRGISRWNTRANMRPNEVMTEAAITYLKQNPIGSTEAQRQVYMLGVNHTIDALEPIVQNSYLLKSDLDNSRAFAKEQTRLLEKANSEIALLKRQIVQEHKNTIAMQKDTFNSIFRKCVRARDTEHTLTKDKCLIEVIDLLNPYFTQGEINAE